MLLNFIAFIPLQAIRGACPLWSYFPHHAKLGSSPPGAGRHYSVPHCVPYDAFVCSFFPGTLKNFLIKKIERSGEYSLAEGQERSHKLDDFVITVANGLALWTKFIRLRDGILYGETYVGKPAPNPPVVKLDGVTWANLLDFAEAGRPLVLNFGSCSWPPFMEKLATVVRISHEYESVADFVTVNMKEAHATDGWAFTLNTYKIANHREMKDRISEAQMLEERNPAGHLVVDTMSDEVCTCYCAVPERLCIVLDGIVAYYGGRGPFDYHLEEVEAWLKDFASKQK